MLKQALMVKLLKEKNSKDFVLNLHWANTEVYTDLKELLFDSELGTNLLTSTVKKLSLR